MTKKKYDFPVEEEKIIEEPIHEEEVKVAELEKYIVACALNVRSAPEKANNVVRILAKDDCVEVIEELGEWCKIGEGEYVMKEFIAKV